MNGPTGKRNPWRGRAVAALVLSPIAAGLLVETVGGPRFRTGIEVGGFCLLAIGGAVGVRSSTLRLRGRRAPTWWETRTWLGRRTRLYLVVSCAMTVLATALVVPEVADWTVPPDRLDVVVRSVFQSWRGPSTEVVTVDDGVYRSPLMTRLSVGLGPLTLVVGHYSRRLLDVDRGPAAIVPGGSPPPPPARLPATAGGALLVAGNGPFMTAGSIGAWWYRDGPDGALALVLTGADPTVVGPVCALVSHFVDGNVTEQTIAETRPATCTGGGHAEPACRLGDGAFLIRTDVPASNPEQLLAELHVADGRVAGIAHVDTGPETLTRIDTAATGCSPPG